MPPSVDDDSKWCDWLGSAVSPRMNAYIYKQEGHQAVSHTLHMTKCTSPCNCQKNLHWRCPRGTAGTRC